MKIIAFDVMGSDHGVEAPVKASYDFLKKNLDYQIILVGEEKEISSFLIDSNDRLTIVDAQEVTSSKGAFGARKADNSMSVAINLVKDGKADVVLSAADSGTFISMCTLILKRLPNLKRPAFMPIFPSKIIGKNFVMLDVGANLETSSEMLVQWSYLGNAFAQSVLEIENPRVGVVNIGTENTKGFDFHQKAHQELSNSNIKINYLGFIEPRELLNDVVDVAVIDGYAGNMVLKTMEGTVNALFGIIKTQFKSKFIYSIGGLLAKGAFKSIKKNYDYRNVASAWIIGLNGLAIKAHGSSDIQSFVGSLNQAKLALDNNALDKLKESWKEQNVG